MTPTEIIYKLLDRSRMTQTELAEATGYKSQGTIANILKRNNMSIATFEKIMFALGYEIVVRPFGDNEKTILVEAKEE